MKHYTDKSVKLITDTKNPYPWGLQEFGDDGSPLGGELVPWFWTLYFDVTNLRHSYSLKKNDDSWDEFSEEGKSTKNKEKDVKIDNENLIVAELIPSDKSAYLTHYSMFGTKREIKEILLTVRKADEANCSAWGTVKHTFELDFRNETAEDSLGFYLNVPPREFEGLTKMIAGGAAEEALFWVKGVDGFYSDWSPGISTSNIKVLTNYKNEQNLEIPNGTEITPPRLGVVKDFELTLSKKRKLKTKSISPEVSEAEKWVEAQVETCVKRLSYEENSSEDSSKIGSGSKDEDDFERYSVNEGRIERLHETRKYTILAEMLYELASYSENNDLIAWEREDLSNQIFSLLSDLSNAFDQDKWQSWKHEDENSEATTDRYVREWQLWEYPEINLPDIKKGEVPYIDLDALSEAAATYLKLPIKNRSIDRIFVHALVTFEITTYASKMLYSPKVLGDQFRSPLTKSHPLWRFIKDYSQLCLIIVIIPIILLFSCVFLLNFNEDWAVIIGMGFLGIWALLLLVGVLTLPKSWLSEIREKRRIGNLIAEMDGVRLEISGPVVSAKHILERLNKTTEQGAMWPSAVFPLLDDIIRRGEVL